MAEDQGQLIGIADEYGTIWSGEPGASERIGDFVLRSDGETSEVRLSGPKTIRVPGRSSESYEREIRSLSATLDAECRNSSRIAQTGDALRAEAVALVRLVDESGDSLGAEWLAFAEAMECLRRAAGSQKEAST